ncbi:hypothetical protein [Undibacterium sp.]|uniref:hypothetical protein n=1 Tax=Undibacterium sp. TaxID=1914977 RepID=UPI00272ABC7A|nr:hypothetical protein [Undibacterium sp.]
MFFTPPSADPAAPPVPDRQDRPVPGRTPVSVFQPDAWFVIGFILCISRNADQC